MLKKEPPDGVGNGGERGKVDEDCRGGEVGNNDPSTEDYANKYHKSAADNELIARDEYGLLVFGEALHKNRREGKGDGGEDNEAVARQVKGELKTVEVDDNDARKAEHAGNYLSGGQLLLPENQACDKHAEERGGAAEDSALNAGGVGQAYVEEEILNNRLKGADCENSRYVSKLWYEEFSAGNTVNGDG